MTPSTVIISTARDLHTIVAKQQLQNSKGLPAWALGGYWQCRNLLLVVGGLLQVACVALAGLPQQRDSTGVTMNGGQLPGTAAGSG